MADIVEYFNWTYVNTVASEGEYGEMGIDSFRQECRHRNICIAVSEKVPLNADASRFDEIIGRLKVKTMARVVILFLRVEDARDLMSAAKRQNSTGHFIWIASDGWGKEEMPVRVAGNEIAAEGALTIELQTTPISEFDTYFRRLTPDSNGRNPWFREYWSHAHDCAFADTAVATTTTGDNGSVKGRYQNSSLSLPTSGPTDRAAAAALSVGPRTGGSGKRRCTGREQITAKIYTQESKIQFVFDAVYAFAHALHSMIDESCGHLRPRTGSNDSSSAGRRGRGETAGGLSSAAAAASTAESALAGGSLPTKASSSPMRSAKFKKCVRSLQGGEVYKYLLNVSFNGQSCVLACVLVSGC